MGNFEESRDYKGKEEVMKQMELKKNSAGGIDLIIERDAGNRVRILTGKREYSLKVWRGLHILCEKAIGELTK